MYIWLSILGVKLILLVFWFTKKPESKKKRINIGIYTNAQGQTFSLPQTVTVVTVKLVNNTTSRLIQICRSEKTRSIKMLLT